MYYSQIIKYQRYGDKVVPIRVSRANGFGGKCILDPTPAYACKTISWAELFGNHTSWIAADVARREEQHQRKAA